MGDGGGEVRKWVFMVVVLAMALALSAAPARASESRAEIIELPATFKAAVVPAPVVKCENGSCWVYHGTNVHVDFSAAPATRGTQSFSVSQCGGGNCSFARVECCGAARETRSREVVENDCDWRNGR